MTRDLVVLLSGKKPATHTARWPPTAGTTAARALNDTLPRGSLTRGARGKLHPGWRDIPADAAGRPVLVFVRNPRDWYVSWCHVVVHHQPDNLIWRLWFGSGQYTFAETIRNACSVSEQRDDPYVKEALRRGNRLFTLMADGHDFYTARFLDFVDAGIDSDLLTIGRSEALFDDLEAFLARAGVAVGESEMAQMRATKRLQVTPHRPYREYYRDRELRELVGASCSWFVERFSYEF